MRLRRTKFNRNPRPSNVGFRRKGSICYFQLVLRLHLKPRGIYRSKIASACFAAALAVVFAFTSNLSAQQPAGSQPAHEHAHGPAPAPTNLQVLPKTMTGDEVHELMHKWEADLGTECSSCHSADPKNIGPNGRPRLNFADDSKPEKATARLMVRMVEEINAQYIGKIDDHGQPPQPVSCGTCHRGHLDPPAFVAPPDHDHDHPEHEAPPPTPK
jgi:hypothetical protein